MVARVNARAGPIQYDRARVENRQSGARGGSHVRDAVLLALATTAFLYLVTFRGGTFVYLFHKATTGVWVDEGARVAAGERMYRDFSDVVGPGIVYLNAALIRLFGARLDVLAWAGIAMGVTVAVLLHVVTARVGSRTASLFAAILFVVLVFAPGRSFGGPEWPALASILLGLLPVMKGPASLARACLAGLSLGLASLFQFEMGIGAALGVAAHLLRDERGKGLACVVFGLAFLALPALVFEAWPQRLAELRWELRWGQGDAWGVRLAGWLALVVGGAVAAIAALRRGRPRAEAATRLVARAGLGVLVAPAVAHVDAYALAVQSTVLLPCLAVALGALERPRATIAWTARAVAAAVLVTSLLHGAAGLIVRRQLAEDQVRQRFRAGTAWIGAPAPDLEWIERNTAPGDPIFAFPAGGMFYFLTRTRNPTSFPAMVEGRFTADDQRRAVAEIERARPALGVWLGAQRTAVPPGRPSLDVLYEGILRSYEPEGTLANGTVLLRRRRATGP